MKLALALAALLVAGSAQAMNPLPDTIPDGNVMWEEPFVPPPWITKTYEETFPRAAWGAWCTFKQAVCKEATPGPQRSLEYLPPKDFNFERR